MRSVLTAYVKGKKGTLKYEFALAAFLVWVGYLIRIACSDNPEWIAAQAVPFGTVTTTVFLFIGTAVGLQTYQNIKGKPGDDEPGWENGELDSPAGDNVARRAG